MISLVFIKYIVLRAKLYIDVYRRNAGGRWSFYSFYKYMVGLLVTVRHRAEGDGKKKAILW
jgi:hypothetical protein